MKDVARKLLKEALKKKKKILFADETCFTKRTLPRKTFASKGNSIQVDMELLNIGFRSALCAINIDG